MKVNGMPYRSIWLNENGWSADIIDQTRLPHEFAIKTLRSMQDAAEAISIMRVRGAPLIGATAAYGLALAMREDAGDENLQSAAETRGLNVTLGGRFFHLHGKNDKGAAVKKLISWYKESHQYPCFS